MRAANPVNFPEFRSKLDQEVVKIGDLVQWTSNGVDQFETPRRVRGVQTHEGKRWVFVEGTKTGLPISEVTVTTPASDDSAPSSTIARSAPGAAPMMSKECEWLRGSLSRDTSYRLIVSGHLGANELGKLIKLLQAQKAVLEDDTDTRHDPEGFAIGTAQQEPARLVSVGQNERPKRIG
jgi:hypothetical protein